MKFADLVKLYPPVTICVVVSPKPSVPNAAPPKLPNGYFPCTGASMRLYLPHVISRLFTL
jgi:hypothetical protein